MLDMYGNNFYFVPSSSRVYLEHVVDLRFSIVWGVREMQRGQNSRTAGAVSYGVGFFRLVNIMQPQNCTPRLRRLV